MKLSIEAELVYNFAEETQVVANLEASRTSDQIILSESLDIQPPSTILSDTTPHGDRRIRASLSGDVTIRYSAVVENNRRQLLPQSGRQHVWSDLPSEVLPFLLPVASAHPTNSCGSRSVSLPAPATESLGSCRYWSGSTATWIMLPA